MNQESCNRSSKGVPLLLALLLGLSLAGRMMPVVGAKPLRCERTVFVEFKGDVAWPGVFAACETLDLTEWAAARGGVGALVGTGIEAGAVFWGSGTAFDVKVEAGKAFLSPGEMSPFYKATLGIPIQINTANPEALTAVPGIGLSLAHRIVRERDRRGGFRGVEELMAVSGIGAGLYKRIRPHLSL